MLENGAVWHMSQLSLSKLQGKKDEVSTRTQNHWWLEGPSKTKISQLHPDEESRIDEHDVENEIQLHNTDDFGNPTVETHNVYTNGKDRVKTSTCGRQIKKPKKLELYDCT